MLSGVFAFAERMQQRTREVKLLLLPELQRIDPLRPWSVSALEELARNLELLDPGLHPALQHALEYELPLLQFEEEHADLDDGAFADALAAFEAEHWQRLYTEEAAAEDRDADFLCALHRIRAADVQDAAQTHGVYDVDPILRFLGGDPSCSNCRTGAARVLVDLIKERKAEGVWPA